MKHKKLCAFVLSTFFISLVAEEKKEEQLEENSDKKGLVIMTNREPKAEESLQKRELPKKEDFLYHSEVAADEDLYIPKPKESKN